MNSYDIRSDATPSPHLLQRGRVVVSATTLVNGIREAECPLMGVISPKAVW